MRWIAIGGAVLFLIVVAWLYGRVTKNGPDPDWSARQDSGPRQIRRSRWGI
jgi:hypothetical protein